MEVVRVLWTDQRSYFHSWHAAKKAVVRGDVHLTSPDGQQVQATRGQDGGDKPVYPGTRDTFTPRTKLVEGAMSPEEDQAPLVEVVFEGAASPLSDVALDLKCLVEHLPTVSSLNKAL